MTAIADFTSIATILLGRTPTQAELLRVGDAVAAVDPLNLGGWLDQWEVVGSVQVVDGGTGFAVDDILTVVGGDGTAATLIVVSEAGGVITEIGVNTGGNYTTFPSNPVSITGGVNSDATFNVFSVIQSAVRQPTNEEKAQLCLDTMKQFIVRQVKAKARQDKINELDVNRDSEIQTAENTAAADFS